MKKRKDKKNNTLITQSNALIEASYKITLIEKRIVLFMLLQVDRDDDDFKLYRINLRDFIANLSTQSKSLYEEVKGATESLLKKVLNIRTKNSHLQINFISSAEYEDGKGYVELSFDPKLKPFLLDLKECFTTYDIRNIMSLRSVHSIRIYEILKQYQAIGERILDLEELKSILGLSESYKDYGPFKKRVLMNSQKELNDNCDLTFDFEEIKDSRKVSHIKFKIKKNLKDYKEDREVISHPKSVMVEKLVNLGIDEGQAKKYIEIKDLKQIEETIEYAQLKHREKKIHTSLSGYVKSLLDSNFQLETQFERDEKQKELEIERIEREEETKINMLKSEFKAYREEIIELELNMMSEDDKLSYFNSLSGTQRAIAFDEKGRLKEMFSNTLLRLHITQKLKLDDTDEFFQKWVLKHKGLSIRQIVKNGSLTWTIESVQTKLI